MQSVWLCIIVIIIIIFMNHSHQIVLLFDMIAKIPEAAITLGECWEAVSTLCAFINQAFPIQVECG